MVVGAPNSVGGMFTLSDDLHKQVTFIDSGLVDEICWFRAASIMGGDGLPAIAPMAVNSPENAFKFRRIETIDLDGDVLERYLRLGNED